MRYNKFIDSLYSAGWSAPCDAQHAGAKALWERLFPALAECEEDLEQATVQVSRLHAALVGLKRKIAEVPT